MKLDSRRLLAHRVHTMLGGEAASPLTLGEIRARYTTELDGVDSSHIVLHRMREDGWRITATRDDSWPESMTLGEVLRENEQKPATQYAVIVDLKGGGVVRMAPLNQKSTEAAFHHIKNYITKVSSQGSGYYINENGESYSIDLREVAAVSWERLE